MPDPVDNVPGTSLAESAWANSAADAINELIGDLYSGDTLELPWGSLTGVPASFAPSAHDHSSASSGGNVPWTSISGKPATFTPATHASSHASGAGDPVTPAAIGAWTKGTGSTGARIFVTSSDPASSAAEGDVWIDA